MRRKRKRQQSEVELNLAAMLDMAFQLLAFFILTFKPSPVEGQVLLRMPPPQPVTKLDAAQQAGADSSNISPVQGLNTLIISAIANSDGSLKQTSIGESAFGNLAALERRLTAVIADPTIGFDQVIVQVDSRLRYEALMQLIDICTRQKLPSGEHLSKLSFVELPGG